MSARLAFLALALGLLGGCATSSTADPRDPLEPLNRAVYRFNDGFDTVIGKPVARAYRGHVPGPVQTAVRNFFSNLADPFIGVNNALQGKLEEAVNDWGRFVFNSTFGLFGLNDLASQIGMEKHDEDFGQTFGRWGVGTGPYLVLPFFGSSDVRDGVGLGVNLYTDPLGDVRPIDARNSLIALRVVSVRADLLEASRLLEQAALDKYVFQRDAYLQRRRSLVYDGHPPRERFDDDDAGSR